MVHVSSEQKNKPWKFRILNPNKSLPVKFAFFSKIRLTFNQFYCIRKFVNKHFTYPGHAYLRK